MRADGQDVGLTFIGYVTPGGLKADSKVDSVVGLLMRQPSGCRYAVLRQHKSKYLVVYLHEMAVAYYAEAGQRMAVGRHRIFKTKSAALLAAAMLYQVED